MDTPLISEVSRLVTIKNRTAATRTTNSRDPLPVDQTNAIAPTRSDGLGQPAQSCSPQHSRDPRTNFTPNETQRKKRRVRIRSPSFLFGTRGSTESKRKKQTGSIATSSQTDRTTASIWESIDTLPLTAPMSLGHSSMRTSALRRRDFLQDSARESQETLSPTNYKSSPKGSLAQDSRRSPLHHKQDSSWTSLSKEQDICSLMSRELSLREVLEEGSPPASISPKRDNPAVQGHFVPSLTPLDTPATSTPKELQEQPRKKTPMPPKKQGKQKSKTGRLVFAPTPFGYDEPPVSTSSSALLDERLDRARKLRDQEQENTETPTNKRDERKSKIALETLAPACDSYDLPALTASLATLSDQDSESSTKSKRCERRLQLTGPPLLKELPSITFTPATPATLAPHEWAISRTGLPALPLEAAHMWETPFPGNSRELTLRLLQWHEGMRKQFLFSAPAGSRALPEHPTSRRPVNVALVMMQLWETTRDGPSECNKDVYCIGPGEYDAMIYCEVDVVSERRAPQEKKPNQKSKMSKVFQKLRGGQEEEFDTVERNERWAFIVVKGKKEKGDYGAAPYLTLAFRKDDVAKSSDCLFTVYPDEVPLPESTRNSFEPDSELEPEPEPLTPAFEPQPIHRYASMPAMRRAFSSSNLGHGPSTHTLRPLRTVSSLDYISPLAIPANSSVLSLPPPTYPPVEIREDGWTVRRTTFWLKKTLVCVEGFRVDLTAFREWIEAVGRGEGKMMVYCESERIIL
ncbi:hypothetical protein BDV96DRAFT_45709 [Lophiotrema nucula]|uniref:Uncharacterized protein n=1 Tax=Lophiotrema nucula TaxID=690887 RepID=A0A6A5ZAX8_9PLEO|nr:hypothetical protein BDV96DRAFT_45709 [Lophiotrema nucula]